MSEKFVFSLFFSDLAKSVIYGSEPAIVDSDKLSEISLDQTNESENYVDSAPTDYNPLQNLDTFTPESDTKLKEEENFNPLAAQATAIKDSLSQLPGVASSVFSSFSSILKGTSPNPQINKVDDVLDQQTTEQTNSIYYNPYSYPQSSESAQDIPTVAPIFYSPSDTHLLQRDSNPLSANENSSNLYRLKERKKTYAPVPGLNASGEPVRAFSPNTSCLSTSGSVPQYEQSQQKENSSFSLSSLFSATPLIDKIQSTVLSRGAEQPPASQINNSEQPYNSVNQANYFNPNFPPKQSTSSNTFATPVGNFPETQNQGVDSSIFFQAPPANQNNFNNTPFGLPAAQPNQSQIFNPIQSNLGASSSQIFAPLPPQPLVTAPKIFNPYQNDQLETQKSASPSYIAAAESQTNLKPFSSPPFNTQQQVFISTQDRKTPITLVSSPSATFQSLPPPPLPNQLQGKQITNPEQISTYQAEKATAPPKTPSPSPNLINRVSVNPSQPSQIYPPSSFSPQPINQPALLPPSAGTTPPLAAVSGSYRLQGKPHYRKPTTSTYNILPNQHNFIEQTDQPPIYNPSLNNQSYPSVSIFNPLNSASQSNQPIHHAAADPFSPIVSNQTTVSSNVSIFNPLSATRQASPQLYSAPPESLPSSANRSATATPNANIYNPLSQTLQRNQNLYQVSPTNLPPSVTNQRSIPLNVSIFNPLNTAQINQTPCYISSGVPPPPVNTPASVSSTASTYNPLPVTAPVIQQSQSTPSTFLPTSINQPDPAARNVSIFNPTSTSSNQTYFSSSQSTAATSVSTASVVDTNTPQISSFFGTTSDIETVTPTPAIFDTTTKLASTPLPPISIAQHFDTSDSHIKRNAEQGTNEKPQTKTPPPTPSTEDPVFEPHSSNNINFFNPFQTANSSDSFTNLVTNGLEEAQSKLDGQFDITNVKSERTPDANNLNSFFDTSNASDIDKENSDDLQIQNFFNNPPPLSDTQQVAQDRNFNYIGRNQLSTRIEKITQAKVSDSLSLASYLAEPPSSAQSELSECADFSADASNQSESSLNNNFNKINFADSSENKDNTHNIDQQVSDLIPQQCQ